MRFFKVGLLRSLSDSMLKTSASLSKKAKILVKNEAIVYDCPLHKRADMHYIEVDRINTKGSG